MNPGEVAVGAREVVELRLLPGPEDAESEEAHQIHDEARCQPGDRAAQRGLAVNAAGVGNADVENEERHRDGEEPVAQRGKTFEALARDPVVERAHGP